MSIVERIVNSFVFWGAWILIPLVMEIIPSIGSVFVLLKKRLFPDPPYKPAIYPEISIIVPVYNSSSTLEACIRSINDSDYQNSRISVFLVNNQGTDDSFSVYARCQEMFPDLHIQWLNAKQGKARALNLAIYNSKGKYIVHIDSDGTLEKSALKNLVDKFEQDPSINVMTGAIMIDPDKVQAYHRGPSRLLRKLEFMEYAQAFLAGRNSDATTNSIYTLSGAFSAFRKSAILKSRLYSTDTICEDTQITFQMRYLQHERVHISPKSIFFTDPIESMDKLYIQRQRWQRGSLEVSKMFANDDKLAAHKLFTDVNVKTLMYDHAFAFPRMIWYLALMCLMFIGYSANTVLMSNVFLFALYAVCGYFYFFAVSGFLADFPELRKYYRKQWYVIPLLPIFNMVVFFMRLAGIINSIGTDSSWRTRTASEEMDSLGDVLKKDVSGLRRRVGKVRDAVNGDPEEMYAPKTTEQKLKGSVLGRIAAVAVTVLSIVLIVVCKWSNDTFNISLSEIINTLLGPLQGTGGDTVSRALKFCLPPIIVAIVVIMGLMIFFRVRAKRILASEDGEVKQRRARRALRLKRMGAGCTCALFAASMVYVNDSYDVVGYMKSRLSNSYIYEQFYADPNDVKITAPAEKKNLIYIYMESMETTYADKENGGFQEKNLIPELTRLAEENLSFSIAEEGVGGFCSNQGATWTLAAMYTTMSGVPFALPASDAVLEGMERYASGLTTIGEILGDNGYQNEFLCGSDAEFGNRAALVSQHGDYEIFDLFTAREKGYIPEDYYVWWGFEDMYLYRIAKDEITRLASEDKPFNFTMLTVDTHFPDGYVCSLCGTDHGEVAANVVECADRQLGEFIDWCKQQPFYEDTVIVITGDHPRMDTVLVNGVQWTDRRVYDCFINAQVEGEVNRHRQCTAMDIFPTTLAAMGFEIEGDRLGLGVNLFSQVQTLAETLGYKQLDVELSKNSSFYVQTFAPELMGIGSY